MSQGRKSPYFLLAFLLCFALEPPLVFRCGLWWARRGSFSSGKVSLLSLAPLTDVATTSCFRAHTVSHKIRLHGCWSWYWDPCWWGCSSAYETVSFKMFSLFSMDFYLLPVALKGSVWFAQRLELFLLWCGYSFIPNVAVLRSGTFKKRGEWWLCKAGDLSSIPRSHVKMKRHDQLHKVVLWTPHAYTPNNFFYFKRNEWVVRKDWCFSLCGTELLTS